MIENTMHLIECNPRHVSTNYNDTKVTNTKIIMDYTCHTTGFEFSSSQDLW